MNPSLLKHDFWLIYQVNFFIINFHQDHVGIAVLEGCSIIFYLSFIS